MGMLVNVYCPSCGGSGSNPAEGLLCGYCLGQGHIRVDRDLDGTVPSGMQEWVEAELPPVPENPLVLRGLRR